LLLANLDNLAAMKISGSKGDLRSLLETEGQKVKTPNSKVASPVSPFSFSVPNSNALKVKFGSKQANKR